MLKLIRLLLTLALIAIGTAQAGVYEDVLAAAYNSRTEEVVELLHRGLDVNTADRDGSTLLLIAARTGNLKLVEFLLINRGSVFKANRYGDTPLLSAAIQGYGMIVVRLLDAGAEINPKGWTPLHYAVFSNHHELVKTLLHRGADIDQRAPNSRTALMLAASLGHVETVRVLLEASADYELEDAQGMAARDIAAQQKHAEIVQLIELADKAE